MMKSKHIVLIVCMVVLVLAILSGCKQHEHVYGEWVVTSEANCADKGVETRTCECGDEQTKSIEAIGHSYGEWTITTAAKCTVDGVETRTCECGDKETKSIAATGHSYGEWTITTAAKCTVEGVETRTCECGDKETKSIAATGHSYGEWTITTAAKCTADGVETRICKCGDKQTKSIAATGHSYGEWTTTTAATCTAKGTQTRTCKCGDKQTKSIAATGHSYGEWATTTAATCTAKGTQTRICKCGKKETKEISATGHKWKDATCTAAKTCTKCSSTTGSALGHSKNSEGYCTRCGKKLTIDMNKVVGHPDNCSTTSFFGFCFYKNSVDGIKVCWGGQNLSGKTVNYYSVTIYFYNPVGDPAYSEITGQSSKTIRYVGPVEPNADMIIFDIVDYVPTCSKVVIGDITLEYADGTSDTGWYGWSTTNINKAIS